VSGRALVRGRLGAFVLAWLAVAAAPGCAQDRGPADLGAAREAAQTGDYDSAVDAYRALARAGADFPASGRGWARALASTGKYDEALEALDEAAARGPAGAGDELDGVRGSIERTLGRAADAEASLRRAIDGGASDAELARLELARLLWDRGARDDAFAIFDGFIDFYNASSSLGSRELSAVGTALTYLGRRDSQLFHDAVRAYEEAIKADPGDPEPRVLLGLLFLSKYDSEEAGGLIREAIDRNPKDAGALLALGRRAQFDGSYDAIDLTERSLEVNPNDPEARAFLARLYLDLEDPDRAETEARRALDTNPSSLAAWTELAAAAHMRGDDAGFAEARDRVLSIDPAHAELYEALAEVAYRTHRYDDAVEFAGEAVRLDPTAWPAYAALGLNQLRVGAMAEGRGTLESAFAGDPFNVWVKNTLDMLDELETFDRVESERFVFHMHPSESALLAVYAPGLAEEAFDAMAARYGYEPPTPISVEIFDRHADFSVRTVGLAGIGALGVSFGSVLAMDSPGAATPGGFNWGSTLWHEISHAFTLGYTDHRVPRWLSEGLAVLDERHGREGWGSDVSPSFLVAFKAGRLPSLERFNYGFVRPAYPGQVQHSYYLASILCELIEDQFGIEGIRRMLDGYRDGLDTEAVFVRVFGEGLAAFDGRLHAYISDRFGTAIAGLDEEDGHPGGAFLALMTAGTEQAAAGRTADAITSFEQAREMFPEYAGADAPTLALASLYRERGDDDGAIAALREFTAMNENHLDARLALADLLEARGDSAGARDALAETAWIDPYRPELHARLAASREEAGDWIGAATERRAVLALDPADRAEAYYRLARTLQRGGHASEARTTVLRALEIAPNYQDALNLLIEIRGGGG